MKQIATFNGSKIFKVEDLFDCEIDNKLSEHINNTASLTYSLVIGMFDHIGVIEQIMKKLSIDYEEAVKFFIQEARENEGWFDNYQWTTKQHDEYHKKLTKVYMNVDKTDRDIAESRASWFLLQYGFKITGEK